MIIVKTKSSAQQLLEQTHIAAAKGAPVNLTAISSLLLRNVLRTKVRKCCLHSGTDEVVRTVPGDSCWLYIQ